MEPVAPTLIQLCATARTAVLDRWYEIMGAMLPPADAIRSRSQALATLVPISAALTQASAKAMENTIETTGPLAQRLIDAARVIDRVRIWLEAFVQDPNPWSFGPRPRAIYPVGSLVGPDPSLSPASAAEEDVIAAREAIDSLLHELSDQEARARSLSSDGARLLERLRTKSLGDPPPRSQ